MAGPEVQQSAVASEPIFGKKFMNKLGGMANESAASTVSAFARKQMEKMGWTEGKGLGKEEQGVVTHVRVKKREEFMGVGVEKVNMEEQKNQWWYNAYDKIADKIKIAADSDDEAEGGAKKKSSKKKSSKKKRKRDEEGATDNADAAREKKFRIPTDEELFAATGGKLFGRRAYGSCNGKLKRDELLQSGKFELKDKKKKDKETKGSSTSSSGNDDEEQKSKKDKKKEKKEKKEKKKLAKAEATKKQKAKADGSSSESD